MGLKNWINNRRESKETQERFNELTEEELQELGASEKFAYLEVAKKQVTYRGKINAYKDFAIDDEDKQEIDIKDGIIKDTDDEEDEDEEEDDDEEDEVLPIKPVERDNEINNQEIQKNVYQTVQQL